MLSSWLCCLCFGPAIDEKPTARSEEMAAVEQLKKKGAAFSDCAVCRLHLDREPRSEDRVGYFIILGPDWKGTPKDLRLLNKLSNVRELIFSHNSFNDDWVAEIEPAPTLECLVFMGRGLTDKGFKHFQGLRNLQTLELRATSVTDEGLATLGNFAKLRGLLLLNLSITNRTLQSVGKLKNLEVLEVQTGGPDGAGLIHLQDLTKLRRLHLGVNDDKKGRSGLHYLSALTNLEELSAAAKNITVADARVIGRFKSLRKLDLSLCPVTDRALSQMAGLDKLEELNLEFAKITGAAGPTLGKMKSLKWLQISHTGVSDAIASHLVQLPQLRRVCIYNTNIGVKGRELLKDLILEPE